MRIPLLVNANPKNTREGAWVLLKAGTWEYEFDVKDTKSRVELISRPDGSILAKAVVIEPGKESSISVWAKQCPSQWLNSEPKH